MPCLASLLCVCVTLGAGGCPFQDLQLSVHLGEHFLELRLGLERSSGTGKPSRDNFPLPSQFH